MKWEAYHEVRCCLLLYFIPKITKAKCFQMSETMQKADMEQGADMYVNL